MADRISDLPDELLTLIISLLPLPDLLTTNSVCRRWRGHWKLTPRLDFDTSGERKLGINALCHAVSYHKAKLNTCIISSNFLANNKATTNHIRTWIRELSLKGITKLIIDKITNTFQSDPYEILGMPSLQDLFLCGTGYNFSGRQPPAKGIGLRSLRLEYCTMNNNDLGKLIEGAPRLERLSLSCLCTPTLQDFGTMDVRSEVLKLLEVEFMWSLIHINIDAPALTSLKLNCMKLLPKTKKNNLLNNSLLNTPSLFSLNTSDVAEFGDYRYNGTPGKYLGLSRKIILMIHRNGADKIPKSPKEAAIFRSLRRLIMDFKLHTGTETLRATLIKCTNLMELGVIIGSQDKKDSKKKRVEASKSTFWRADVRISCLEHHMKYLWIRNFTGKHLEMEFLKFMLRKAMMLKRLVISYKDCSTDPLEVVRSFPRMSEDLNIFTNYRK